MAWVQRHRYEFIFAFFAFHFAVAGLSMAKLNSRVWPKRLAAPAAVYARTTGTGAGFGFFSPAIPKEVQVTFDVDTADRGLIHTTLQEETVPEVSFRVGNMIRLMNRHFRQEKVMRSLAASLSANIFSRYPSARTVTLNAFIYDFPSMEEARNGKRAEPKKVYSVKFGRATT